MNLELQDIQPPPFRTNYLNPPEMVAKTREMYLAQHPQSKDAVDEHSDYLRDWTPTGSKQAQWIKDTLREVDFQHAFSSGALRTRKLALSIRSDAKVIRGLGLTRNSQDRVTAMSKDRGHRGKPLADWLDNHSHGYYMLAHGLFAWNAVFSCVQPDDSPDGNGHMNPYTQDRVFIAGHAMQLSAMIYAIGVLFNNKDVKALGRVGHLEMGDMFHLEFWDKTPDVAIMRCPKFE